MRWISHPSSAINAWNAVGYRRSFSGSSKSRLWLALLAFLLLTASAAEEKRLSVYTPQGSYSISVLEREGKEYVPLLDLLQPLGSDTAKRDGDKWKLRFQATGRPEIEAEFRAGKSTAKVRGKTIELGAPFLLEGKRGLAPVSSLGEILAKLLPPPIEFRGNARRLFVGGAFTQFSTDFQKGTPPHLVLHFTAPVNPMVSTEPGRLRLVFTRDPVTAVPATQHFDDKVITTAIYSETNGTAELTVNSTAPLTATFGEGGRSITISPAATEQVATSPAPPVPSAPAEPNEQPPSAPLPAPSPAPAGPRFVVVIDPGHGGEEHGAMLSASLPEKEVTLAWARRLRAALDKQGIAAVLLRDADVALTLEQRAAAANSARPSVFVTLHAASNGRGVRVFTARLKTSSARSDLLPWETAQAAFLGPSGALARKIAEEVSKRQIPVGRAEVLLRPLNNVAGAALAIEVAPPDKNVEGLTSPLYQQAVCSAIAAGVTAVREGLR